MKQIKTKDLIFINYNAKYAEQCHKNFLSQQETAKYTLWRPTSSVEDAKLKLNYWNSSTSGKGVFWLIQEIGSRQVVGFVACDEIEENVYGNIGIAIGLEFIKKGYGTQSLNALVQYINENNGKEIYYSHFKENEASQKLALKCGFKYIKTENRIRRHDGKEFEELFYILNINKT